MLEEALTRQQYCANNAAKQDEQCGTDEEGGSSDHETTVCQLIAVATHMQHSIGIVLRNAKIANQVWTLELTFISLTKSTGRASANTLSVSAYGVSILCILSSATSFNDALIRLITNAARQVIYCCLRLWRPSFRHVRHTVHSVNQRFLLRLQIIGRSG